MPNNGRITVCPFYKNERNNYITCEDTKRRFRYRKTKENYMDNFCDDRWKLCPYAVEMLKAYEKEDQVIPLGQSQKIKALESENKKVNLMLTKAEKRDKAKSEEIKTLKRKNEVVVKKYAELKDRYDQLRETEEKAMQQINEAMQLCEARIAYLLDGTEDKRIDEKKFREWHEHHEFALVPDFETVDDEMRISGWKLNVREVMEDGTERSATETESTGRAETSEAVSEAFGRQ